MKDSRIGKLAKILTAHSTKLKRGETVLFEAFDIPDDLTIELIRAAKKREAKPQVSLKRNRILRELIKNTNSDTAKLNKILDADKGARFVGEFAIGVNPHINKAMTDTLFDEKINGAIHFTPGSAYDEAPNGNKSKIHWDMVLIQTKAYGGGEIYFDDKLIRKDGKFIPKSLQRLNPEHLK